MKFFVLFFASGFGSGYFPIAPGTVGSLCGLLCFVLLAGMSAPVYLVSMLAIFFFSIWVSGRAEAIYGAKDDRRIVIDEIFGMLLGLTGSSLNLKTAVAGFLLFRFFDIVKIFPASFVQKRLDGGLAVVLDDVIAGIYTNISLQILRSFL